MEYLFLSQIIMYKTWKINRKSTKILRKLPIFDGLSLYKIITKVQFRKNGQNKSPQTVKACQNQVKTSKKACRSYQIDVHSTYEND